MPHVRLNSYPTRFLLGGRLGEHFLLQFYLLALVARVGLGSQGLLHCPLLLPSGNSTDWISQKKKGGAHETHQSSSEVMCSLALVCATVSAW